MPGPPLRRFCSKFIYSPHSDFDQLYWKVAMDSPSCSTCLLEAANTTDIIYEDLELLHEETGSDDEEIDVVGGIEGPAVEPIHLELEAESDFEDEEEFNNVPHQEADDFEELEENADDFFEEEPTFQPNQASESFEYNADSDSDIEFRLSEGDSSEDEGHINWERIRDLKEKAKMAPRRKIKSSISRPKKTALRRLRFRRLQAAMEQLKRVMTLRAVISRSPKKSTFY
ncbi:unnamed protein product [Bursaphelenchus xylophilus]|uniref:(pine wood nematode) hypothetical protein n=1 Tax=Bursaphelenchus xylophilus TaxID=6326 RepID=A0A1I7SRL6_BURXY|nr:unnamed protein product [Bursaphelenchus xylophilus]CAG9102187.1 unnamed protein product [Bursaphelenchus xylophilus]